jgi:hypothetical protein
MINDYDYEERIFLIVIFIVIVIFSFRSLAIAHLTPISTSIVN